MSARKTLTHASFSWWGFASLKRLHKPLYQGLFSASICNAARLVPPTHTRDLSSTFHPEPRTNQQLSETFCVLDLTWGLISEASDNDIWAISTGCFGCEPPAGVRAATLQWKLISTPRIGNLVLSVEAHDHRREGGNLHRTTRPQISLNHNSSLLH